MSYTLVHLQKMIDIVGEDEVSQILSTFSCPKAPDVEDFIHRKAIEFARHGWAQTHLVFTSYKKENVLIGYFTLSAKVMTVPSKNLSKTTKKRIASFSTYDSRIEAYCLSAPLIAQLGKNFSNGYDKLISGDELLKMACSKVSSIQIDLGGKYAYLECEDKERLIEFYRDNGFVEFDRRKLDKDEEDLFSEKYLVQMLKYIK